MIPTPTQAPDKHEVRVVRTPVPTKAQLRAQGDAENDPKSMVTARDISSGGLRSPYKSAVAGLVVEGAGTGEVLSDAVASLMHGSEVGAGQHVSARRKLVGEAQGLAPGPSVMPLRCRRSETAGAPWPVSSVVLSIESSRARRPRIREGGKSRDPSRFAVCRELRRLRSMRSVVGADRPHVVSFVVSFMLLRTRIDPLRYDTDAQNTA